VKQRPLLYDSNLFVLSATYFCKSLVYMSSSECMFCPRLSVFVALDVIRAVSDVDILCICVGLKCVDTDTTT